MITPLIALLALQNDWQTYTLGPGMRVDLPYPPQVVSKDGPGASAQPVTWASRYQMDTTVVIGCSPFDRNDPELSVNEVLTGSTYRAMYSAKGKLTGQRDLLMDGWPGAEYRVTNKQGFTGIGRTYVANDHVVTVYVTSSETRNVEEPAKKIFASLRLPKSAGKGPLTTAGPEFKPMAIGKTGVTVDLPTVPQEEKMPDEDGTGRVSYRYVSRYVTRSYLVGYIDLTGEVLDESAQDEIDSLLASMHQSLADGMEKKVKGVVPRPAKVAGRDGYRSKFSIDEGRAQVRVETVQIGPRIFFFMAVTLSPMAKSAEVEGFFGSVKVN